MYNKVHIYTGSETNDVTHMFPLHYEQQHVLLAGMPKGDNFLETARVHNFLTLSINSFTCTHECMKSCEHIIIMYI